MRHGLWMGNSLSRFFIVLTLVIGFLAPVSRSQQEQEPPPAQNPPTDSSTKPDSTKPDTASQNPQQPGSQGENNTAASPPPILAMNSAAPLASGRVSAIQFGPIYLQSVNFLQTGDALTETGQNGTVWGSFSELQAVIVFDRAFRNSHFAVQYEPRLLVENGTVSADASNLNAGWSTVFHLSPRFTASFSNSFNYYSRVAQFDNLSLQADLTTGGLVASNFLEGGGHFLEDRTQLSFQYLISPRSRFEVTPYFDYSKSTGVTGNVSTLAIGDSYGFGLTANYGYLLSPTQSISFSYQEEDIHYSQGLSTTNYQTLTATYSQQLTQTWRFSAGGGVVVSSASAFSGTTTTPGKSSSIWTENGQFSLIKVFNKGSLAFNYYRGQQPGLQITNGFADRYDLSCTRQLSQRLGLNLAAGYYREFLSATNTKGLYAAAGLNYSLTDRWFINLQYGFKNQQNGGAIYQTGDLQYASVGIRWQPGLRPGS
jgi:hypothetical protein